MNFSGKVGEGRNKNRCSTIYLETIYVQRHKDLQELIKDFSFSLFFSLVQVIANVVKPRNNFLLEAVSHLQSGRPSRWCIVAF